MNSKALQNLVRLAVVTAAVVLGLLSSSSCVEAQDTEGGFDGILGLARAYAINPVSAQVGFSIANSVDSILNSDASSMEIERQWNSPELSVEDSLQQTIFMENNFDNSDASFIEIELAEQWARQLEAQQDPEGRFDGFVIDGYCGGRNGNPSSCIRDDADSVEDIQLDISQIEMLWWEQVEDSPQQGRRLLFRGYTPFEKFEIESRDLESSMPTIVASIPDTSIAGTSIEDTGLSEMRGDYPPWGWNILSGLYEIDPLEFSAVGTGE